MIVCIRRVLIPGKDVFCAYAILAGPTRGKGGAPRSTHDMFKWIEGVFQVPHVWRTRRFFLQGRYSRS